MRIGHSAALFSVALCVAACGGRSGQTEGTTNQESSPEALAQYYMGQAGLASSEGDSQGALDNYLQIAPWGDSTAQIPAVQESLAEVEVRLEELNKPNPLLPWNWFD